MKVRCLSIHADYRCGHSGLCCRSGWHVPVEPVALASITGALESGALRSSRQAGDAPFLDPGNAPADVAAILAVDAAGDCIFLDADNRCDIHGQIGDEHLPSTCKQFPRVSVLGPNHTAVSLSHYCPTAARMLVDSPLDLRIVSAPASLLTAGSLEGLDARDALPPLLRPGMLMGWPEHERWEQHVVQVLNRDELTAEQALRALADDVEAVRDWTPGAESLADRLDAVCSRRADWRPEPPFPTVDLERARSLHLLARRAVPSDLPGHVLMATPSDVPGLDPSWTRWVEPVWSDLSRPVRRYLAARSFASWCAHQGDGLRTTLAAVETAWAVLVLEACRAAGSAERALDADLLIEALQAADLLLVHLVSPASLAMRLSVAEVQATAPDAQSSVPAAVSPAGHAAP